MSVSAHASALLPETLKLDFPILSQKLYDNRPLIYLDNAASSQRPRSVLEAMNRVYERSYSNVHRGSHYLSSVATVEYESARSAVAEWIGADSPNEIVFTQGTTAAINLVAHGLAPALDGGDEILLTMMEHHSNIVPWQQLAERTGAFVRWVEITDDGRLDMQSLAAALTEKTKIFAFSAVSNVLGTRNPVKELVAAAKAVKATVIVDAAQAAPHEAMDVGDWEADFVAFSGHKMLAPTGIGVLYGRRDLLEAMPPFLGGGSMIRTVTTEGFTPAALPAKFEAGTPPIAEAIAMGAAIRYLDDIGLDAIHRHEQALAAAAHEGLRDVEGLRILGPDPSEKAGIVSFVADWAHPQDIASALDEQGIAVREGHHCTMPLHKRLGIESSARASFYLYNTLSDVEAFVEGMKQARSLFAGRKRGKR
ncbi:MAG TPA: SufS family cysteine desulfurase [Pirellulaceae bacterium]|jgi:cysteine desulfurase/selenocysteine lyase|nr:SufS family cysteine desulfurase [Pirellulaceae bacterium]